MSKPAILIAGIGNIFLGDDAFGVEAVRQFASRTLPEGVRVIDFGIRGIDLTYALLDGAYDAAILVDAVPRGQAPGTLYLIEPEAPSGQEAGSPDLTLQAHNLDPAQVLRMVSAMGGKLLRVLVVGCEPTPLNEDEMEMGLSQPVRAAIPEALSMIESLVERIQSGEVELCTNSPSR